jgi:hypothetical protein
VLQLFAVVPFAGAERFADSELGVGDFVAWAAGGLGEASGFLARGALGLGGGGGMGMLSFPLPPLRPLRGFSLA